MSDVVDNLQKILGSKFKGKVPTIISGSQLVPTEFVTTGSLALDWVWGGGLPIGHGIVIIGKEKSAKSTSCLKMLAQLQAAGHSCAWIDAENTLDKDWAKLHKVNLDNLAVYSVGPGESAEYVLEIARETLSAGYFVFLDSIAVLESEEAMKKKEDKGYAGKTYAGASAPITSFCADIGKILRPKNVSLIIVNQLRDNMSIYGARTRTPGGRALKHMATIMTEFTQGDYIEGAGGEKIGVEVKFFCNKNKVRKPFRERLYELYFSAGINPLKEVIDFAVYYELLEARGSWMYYEGEQLGQGANQVMGYLVKNQDVYKILRAQIVELIKENKR